MKLYTCKTCLKGALPDITCMTVYPADTLRMPLLYGEPVPDREVRVCLYTARCTGCRAKSRSRDTVQEALGSWNYKNRPR